MTISLKQIALKKNNRIRKFKVIKTSEWLETEYYKYLRAMGIFIKQKFIKVAIPGMKVDKHKWQDESYSARLDRLVNQVISETESSYSVANMTRFIKQMILKTDKYQYTKFKTAADYGFGIDISELPDFKGYKQFINSTIEKNISEIKYLRTETLHRLEMSLRTAIQKGKSISQVTNEIMVAGQITHRRAATIARNEIKNLTSALNAKRAVNAGIELYEWQNAGDERVRGNPNGHYPKAKPSHWIMEGLYCRYDNDNVYSPDKGKTWKKRTKNMPKGKPGEDINCRCLALNII
jgi:uncharacterized protein with gpF-like domain